jgi:hypothetical protein
MNPDYAYKFQNSNDLYALARDHLKENALHAYNELDWEEYRQYYS